MLFVSITAHIVATVKKLYEILHISVRSELFLIPKFRLTFKLILKINIYRYKNPTNSPCIKINVISNLEMKKKIFETNCRFDVF